MLFFRGMHFPESERDAARIFPNDSLPRERLGSSSVDADPMGPFSSFLTGTLTETSPEKLLPIFRSSILILESEFCRLDEPIDFRSSDLLVLLASGCRPASELRRLPPPEEVLELEPTDFRLELLEVS